MATSTKAQAAIKKLFRRKPSASTAEFQAAAEKADPSVKGLAPRSFNASYVLPLKRKASTKSSKKKAARKKTKRKVTARKVTARKVRGRKTRRSAAKGLAVVRQMILERDQAVAAALRGKDPRRAYELAAGVDDFIKRIAKALGK